MIVAIDGPAASGKSTAARLLAQRLAVAYLDTGAMYRAVTWAGIRQGIGLADKEALARLAEGLKLELHRRPEGLQVLVDGRDVTEAIRDNSISRQAWHAASNEKVRACLVQWQRRLARQWGNLVTEGRDQGTVVFPDAELKVYLDASEEVRAERRRRELADRGQEVPFEEVLADLRRRDASDRSRKVGPLCPAEDAVTLDTTHMTIAEVVDRLSELVRSRAGGRR